MFQEVEPFCRSSADGTLTAFNRRTVGRWVSGRENRNLPPVWIFKGRNAFGSMGRQGERNLPDCMVRPRWRSMSPRPGRRFSGALNAPEAMERRGDPQSHRRVVQRRYVCRMGVSPSCPGGMQREGKTGGSETCSISSPLPSLGLGCATRVSPYTACHSARERGSSEKYSLKHCYRLQAETAKPQFS